MSRRAPRVALGLSILVATAPAAFGGDFINDAKTGCKVWNPHPTAGESARWSGACKDGFAEGNGILEWVRGGKSYERDEGEWHGGRQTGAGSQSWPAGTYTGQFLDSMPSGKGVLVIGAARYDGAFRAGKPTGNGVLNDASGTFAGMWQDGCFNDGKRRAAIGVSVQSCP